MSDKMFERYGAILAEDVTILEIALSFVIRICTSEQRRARILEIGMHDGGTARGIETFLNLHGIAVDYFGIDPDDGTTRFRHVPNGGTVIVGDSAETFMRIPGDLDLVWVDGCHCINHVILDTVHFAPKVRDGGFMLFHDVNPRGQGLCHQYHGPETPEFGLAIDLAHAALSFPSAWGPWRWFAERVPEDPERLDCGTRAFRKGASE